MVIAASKPDQFSYENSDLKHGIFTYHLLDALSGKADSGDGYVRIQSVYKYLRDKVPETARHLGTQEPVITINYMTEDFVIAVNREKLREINSENIKKKSLDRLWDWYQNDELDGELYESACEVIEKSSEKLNEDDKKVLKLVNDLLSDKISISIFKKGIERINGSRKSLVSEIIKLSSDARSLFDKGLYAEAIEKWREVLKLNSENREASGGIEESERILKELEEKKKQIDGLGILAQSLYNEGKCNEAAEKWIEILNLDPKNITAKDGIKKANHEINKKWIIKLGSNAQKLFENKMYAEAIAELQNVLNLDPEDSKALEQIDECNRILDKMNSLNNSAQILYDKGMYKQAIDKWNEVLNLDPRNQIAIEGINNSNIKIKSKEIKKYCPRCSHPNERGLKYCTQCGARLF